MINSIYTNKEIFLRELISNASDAIDKLYYKSLQENLGLSRGDFKIRIEADKDKRILRIIDNGIGMTAEELENNLGVIARSGSMDFKAMVESKDDINIIGQFGVGFYSAFMVSEKVEVLSKAYGSNEANLWSSSGVQGYNVKKAQKDEYGTTITMYIKPDGEEEHYGEFLEEYRLRSLIKKYSDYVRYPIIMNVEKTRYPEKDEAEGEDKTTEPETYRADETLNSMIPLWKKKKSDITDKEYNDYYKDTFYDYEDPVKVIHTSTEGIVNYQAILYIPGKAPYNYYSKGYEKGLKLYNSGIMIMEKCAELLPDYFSFVKGVVDSELTLNISRETVQQDHQLKKIAANLKTKIKKELIDLLEKDREKYEKFYGEFGLQLKYEIGRAHV
jgi:molecular chaperone HtpG